MLVDFSSVPQIFCVCKKNNKIIVKEISRKIQGEGNYCVVADPFPPGGREGALHSLRPTPQPLEKHNVRYNDWYPAAASAAAAATDLDGAARVSVWACVPWESSRRSAVPVLGALPLAPASPVPPCP